MEQAPLGPGKQSVVENMPTQSVLLATNFMPAKVISEVEVRLGAERQKQRKPDGYLCLTFTTPLMLVLRSLLMMRIRYQQSQRLSEQTLTLPEVPAITATRQIRGPSRNAITANKDPQKMAPGSKPGPAPNTDWLEGVSGLQKLMKQPPIDANSTLISSAHSAAAKELVTPCTPESLVRRISLIPTQQSSILRVLLVESTSLLLRQTAELFQWRRLAMVAWAGSLKRRQRKVKVQPQTSVRLAIWSTQEPSAASVTPGPLTLKPHAAVQISERSAIQWAAVQVRLQRA